MGGIRPHRIVNGGSGVGGSGCKRYIELETEQDSQRQGGVISPVSLAGSTLSFPAEGLPSPACRGQPTPLGHSTATTGLCTRRLWRWSSMLRDRTADARLPTRQDGWTSLIAASYIGHLEVVKLLLEGKANVHATQAVTPRPLPSSFLHTHCSADKDT
jgi:hypothetical protein